MNYPKRPPNQMRSKRRQHNMVFAVIRVRGIVNVNPDIKRTLELLRLTKVNHCALIEENIFPPDLSA